MMQTIYASQFVFPVVTATSETDSDGSIHFKPKNIIGTAFLHSDGYFVTAAHVATEASMCDQFGLGYLVDYNDRNGKYRYRKIESYCAFNEIDVAFLKVEIPNAKAFAWSSEDLGMLSEVQTIGYPYGYDPEKRKINIRGFSGSIVSDIDIHRFTGNPQGYELSFAAPRGLSGSPLLSIVNKTPSVVGMIVGNQSTQMLVHRSTEILDSQTREIIEQHELLQLGLAIKIQAIIEKIAVSSKLK